VLASFRTTAGIKRLLFGSVRRLGWIGGWSCKDQKTYRGSDVAFSNQSCDTGQFLTGSDSSGAKKCAADQTYSNGSGLDLTGNTFSLKSGYQLPQGCSSGQVATTDGSTGWTCSSNSGTPEGESTLTDYTRSNYVDLGDDDTGTVAVFWNSPTSPRAAAGPSLTTRASLRRTGQFQWLRGLVGEGKHPDWDWFRPRHGGRLRQVPDDAPMSALRA